MRIETEHASVPIDSDFHKRADYSHLGHSAFYWFSMALKSRILPYVSDAETEKQTLLHEGIRFFVQVYEHHLKLSLLNNQHLYRQIETPEWAMMVRFLRQWEGMLNGVWHETTQTRGVIRQKLLEHHENRWKTICSTTTESGLEQVLLRVTQETFDIFQLCLERECEWEQEAFYQMVPVMYHIKARVLEEFRWDVEMWNRTTGGLIWREIKEYSSFR